MTKTQELEVDEFVQKLRDFERAYGTEFFAPLTEAEKDEMGGFLLSRASAEMGRHLAKFLTQAADRLEAAEAERDALRDVLGNMRCPRPCNHRPDEFDAKDCVSAGECGCGAAILSGGLNAPS